MVYTCAHDGHLMDISEEVDGAHLYRMPLKRIQHNAVESKEQPMCKSIVKKTTGTQDAMASVSTSAEPI